MSEVVIQRGDGLHLIIQRGVPGAPGQDGVSADWGTLPNKPTVIAAGDTVQEARDAIGLGTLVMADITDKQGKVLDDLIVIEDYPAEIDTLFTPGGYIVKVDLPVNSVYSGASILVAENSGVVTQLQSMPVSGQMLTRYYMSGAWLPWVYMVSESVVANWYSDTTASAADAVINANGSFSRSLFVPAPLAPKITVGLTAEADTDILRPDPLTAAATLPNPTGTPMDGFGFVIELIDNGTARALTWGSDYAAGFAALPTTTTAGKLGQIAVQYRSGKYRCDGVRWMA